MTGTVPRIDKTGGNGSGGPEVLSANDLRWLGEKADGLRGVPLYLVVDEKQGLDVVEEKDLKGRESIIEIRTKSRGPGIPENPELRAKPRIWYKNKLYSDRDLEQADAVFFSQSAVEKFLLPYYMRFKSGAEVQGMENKLFNNEGVIAAIHIPPSFTKVWPPVLAVTPDGDTLTCSKCE